MKRIYKKIFLGSIFCILTVLTADVKEKMEADFLGVNDNIQNEEHHDELQALREKFNLERTQIQKYYNEKIEALKEARRGEIKAIKKDFAGRREILMKKYTGKMRRKPPIENTETVKNVPDKKKAPPKDKKRIRKP